MVAVKLEPSSAATTLKSRVVPSAGAWATAKLAGGAASRALISVRARGAMVRSMRRSVASNSRRAGLSPAGFNSRDAAAAVAPAAAVPISQFTTFDGSPTLASCPAHEIRRSIPREREAGPKLCAAHRYGGVRRSERNAGRARRHRRIDAVADGTRRQRTARTTRTRRASFRRIDTRSPVWSLVVTEDGKTVVAACDDGTVSTVRVYETGGSLLGGITVEGGGAWALALSEDGKLLAGSGQGVVGVWELHSGAPLQTLGTPSGGVLSVAITADGRTAAAGSEHGMLRVWEVSTGRELLAVKAHSGGVRAVAFSPDGRTLATGSSDKSIKLWNVPESALPQYATIREFFRLMAKLTDRTDIEFLQVTENFRVMVKVAEAVQGVPLEVLSQGLTSLIGWVGVLCQRLKETTQNASDTPLATDAYALVLVDEIDAHMHPGWQQVLVKRLGQLFPRVQFIATSHSPLVVGGLEPNEVYRFDRMADGLVQVTQPEVALKGMGAAGLLTSPLFGLRSQLDLETSEALRKKRHLTAKRLRENTEEARQKLDEEIKQLDEKVKYVDSTEFIRDPLYQRFVEAVSNLEPDPEAVPETVVLTPEERRQRAQEAERIVKDLRKRSEEAGTK